MGSRPGTTGWPASPAQGSTRHGNKMVPNIVQVILLMSLVCWCRAYETVNSTQIRIENNSAQRDYQDLCLHRHPLHPPCPLHHLPLCLWMCLAQVLQEAVQGVHPGAAEQGKENQWNLEDEPEHSLIE